MRGQRSSQGVYLGVPGKLVGLYPVSLGQGFGAVHSCFPVFKAASTICARENSVATAAATSGNCFGLTIVGAAGQVILTAGGMPSGSTSSTFRWSWLTWADAKGVMGEDGDTADSSSVEGPLRSFHLLAGPTYVGARSSTVLTCRLTS